MADSQQRQRRPVDVAALDRLAAWMKLRAGHELPGGTSDVSVPRESFMPVVRANVGSPTPITVYRYRLLVPIAQVIRESPTAFRRITIATDEEARLLHATLIRHFGGATMLHQPSNPALGMGARDPDNVATTEENLHVSFEVYAAPVPESDEYFRALRRELEEALCEGVILIERQEVTLV